MKNHEPRVVYLNDLSVGDEWTSVGRTITQAEVSTFAGLSGDYNPLHVDHAWASSRGPFGRPVAHGLLGLSVASGLASQAPRVATLALVQILEWAFHQPVFFGDTLHVVNRVEKIEVRARGKRGLVTWHRRVLNQEDQAVQEGRVSTLVSGPTTDEAERRVGPAAGPESQ